MKSGRQHAQVRAASFRESGRAAIPRLHEPDLTKITVVGGLYLSILCLIPDLMISGIKLQHLALVGNWIDRVFTNLHLRFLLEGLNVQFLFWRNVAADRGRP